MTWLSTSAGDDMLFLVTAAATAGRTIYRIRYTHNTMIRFQQVSLMRGIKPLFDNVDVTLNPGDKIG